MFRSVVGCGECSVIESVIGLKIDESARLHKTPVLRFAAVLGGVGTHVEISARRVGFSVALVGVLLTPPIALAADEGRWFFKLDSFLPMSQDTRVRYDSPLLGQGIELNLEDEPGLDNDFSQIRGSLGVRLGATRRHELEFSYLDIARDNRRSLGSQIELGDIVLPVGVDLVTSVDTTDYELTYKYYFVNRESGRFGAILGVHALEFDSTLSAIVSSSFFGIPVAVPVTVMADTSALIPVVGFSGDWEFAPKWHLSGSLKAMDASFNDIEGSYVELEAAVEHYTFRNLGFGIGFFADEVDAREDTGDAFILGDWNQKREGALVFLRARW